jgi:uncharacterized protein YndB with AHSA1/START domain
MKQGERIIISVETIIDAQVGTVWKSWTTPEDIMGWNSASDDWHTTQAENDLYAGGKFLSRMEAKDGSSGFDFKGIYKVVKTNEQIEYSIIDGRNVRIDFTANGGKTRIVETFEAEETHSIEQQRRGWQSILDNFKKYVELINNPGK